ncbi:gliding motility-associated C-terminal domain-containing protein [Cytophaga aurantiaca]|uniref:gliding motility-associated C-terminal domain-containing protein n=1 Tax=Cytophaga aurantiaca TaxID=29530 RepID=UPI00037085B4|nr:T9SS C-terminal target domain-containing protein [Cytophaga aurantiaca]
MMLKILFTYSPEFTFAFSRKLIGKTIIHYFSLLILFLLAYPSFAEGTKELMPTSSDFGFIQINDRGRKFATYNAPVLNRLYIHICSPGEIIYFGFKQPDNDISFRLKDPSGNIIVPAQALPTSGAGYIANYNQAVAGPQQIVGAAGYNAMSYASLVDGDYYIEFDNPGNAQRIFDFFDITVASGSTAKTGRLWSYSWDMNTNATTNPFTGKMYILSKDSIVTAIDFNGMQPFGAVITANSTGLSNTGNVIADRASKVGDYTLPEYKIFLNDPDPACYPTGSFGSIIAPSKVTGCDPLHRCINITVNKPGQIEIVLDLNGTSGYQPNTKDLLIITNVTAGVNCIPWNSKDGLGNDITNLTTIPLQVNYLNGVTHLPLYDVEANPDGYIVELIRPAGPKPKLYWDDAAITAGTALDAKVNLTGCTSTTGCHKWKNRGNNSSAETINTWWYPNIVTDNLTFDLPPAIVDADTRNLPSQLNDSLVCEHIPSYQLKGNISGTNGGSWTGGSGSFTPSRNVVDPLYVPTLAERNAGSLKLFLSSSVVLGGCPNAKDSILIRFEKAPIINVGTDRILCSRTKTISLTAALTNTTTGIWSGANGTYTAATNTSTTYTISPADLSAGNISLIFTSTGTRLCAQEDDTINILFNKPAEIEVGPPIEICKGKTVVSLAATGDNTAGLAWSGGLGTFQNPNALSTNYTLNSSEINATQINLTLTASKGVCPDSSDILKIIINALPIANAGKDSLICKGTSISFAGNSNAATNKWYTLPSQTVVSNQIAYTAQNVTGANTFVLESTDAKLCKNTDTISVSVYELPDLNPGGPYCLSSGLTLHANASNIPPVSATYIWSLTNTVLQNDAVTSDLNATSSGIYTLTYKTLGCSKDVLVVVNAKPILTSPDTLSSCEGSSINLYTTAATGSTYAWFDSNNTFIQNGSSTNIVAPLSSSKYFVQETDLNGCVNKDSIVAIGTPIPHFTISDAEICVDSIAAFEVLTTNIPSNLLSQLAYEWKYNSSVVSTSKLFSTNNAGTYSIKASLYNCSASEQVNLIVHDLPTSSLPEEYIFCSDNGNTIALDAGNAYKYHWIQTNETTQSISVGTPGTYEVLLYNSFLCKITRRTFVKEECKPSLFLSNAFSPNGDHVNDFYETFDNHVGAYSITIFNRWGEVIFQSTDKKTFWDGYYKGEVMPVGVYPYIITYEGDTDTYKGPYTLEGSVTLIK